MALLQSWLRQTRCEAVLSRPRASDDIEYCLFKASTCRAILAIACSKLLNQCRLKLYHYTSRLRLQLVLGSGFYMRVEADDRTRHHRKPRREQCVESSDHCALANACVTFVQDLAWSLLSVPYIAIPDRRRAVVLVSYVILFLFSDGEVFRSTNLPFLWVLVSFSLGGGATKYVVPGLFDVNLLVKIPNACNPEITMLLIVLQKIRVSDA